MYILVHLWAIVHCQSHGLGLTSTDYICTPYPYIYGGACNKPKMALWNFRFIIYLSRIDMTCIKIQILDCFVRLQWKPRYI